MRKLTYDCFYKGVKIKTTNSFKEANDWKEMDKGNSFKTSLSEVFNEKEKSVKEKEDEKAYVMRVIEAIKRKAKERANAAIV